MNCFLIPDIIGCATMIRNQGISVPFTNLYPKFVRRRKTPACFPKNLVPERGGNPPLPRCCLGVSAKSKIYIIIYKLFKEI